MKNCLNCKQEISNSIKFCPACGQKTDFPPLNFYNILKDFFSTLFNLENKIWTTFKDLWVPAKLPLAYIQGRRSPYYNPVRFFLVILFGFFTVMFINFGKGLKSVDKFRDEQQKNIWEEDLVNKYDSLALTNTVLRDTTIGLRKKLFRVKKDIDRQLNPENKEKLDSIMEARGLETKPTQLVEVIDSMLETQSDTLYISTEDKSKIRGDFTLFSEIKASEMFRLTPEELTAKHGDDHKFYSFFLVQTQKIVKDLRGSLAFMLGNGTWAIILMVLSMSLLFKLLYIRRNYSYVEHFILQINGHTRMLFSGLILILLAKILPGENFYLFPIWLLLSLIYFYKAMRKFYRQSRSKTILKLVLAITGYTFIFGGCITLIMMLSAVLL